MAGRYIEPMDRVILDAARRDPRVPLWASMMAWEELMSVLLVYEAARNQVLRYGWRPPLWTH